MTAAPLLDIWINCPDPGTAHRIAEALLERRLVACANVHAPIRSVYRWEGRIERAIETPLVLRTRGELFDTVAHAARALHPWETPSIHAVAVARITEDYGAWVASETTGAG